MRAERQEPPPGSGGGRGAPAGRGGARPELPRVLGDLRGRGRGPGPQGGAAALQAGLLLAGPEAGGVTPGKEATGSPAPGAGEELGAGGTPPGVGRGDSAETPPSPALRFNLSAPSVSREPHGSGGGCFVWRGRNSPAIPRGAPPLVLSRALTPRPSPTVT